MNKQELVKRLNTSFAELIKAGEAVKQENFNVSKNNKWTAAENLAHLVTSTKMTIAGYTLPKILPALLYGKTKAGSRSFEDIVALYKGALQNGGKASGVYVPKKTDYNKERLIHSLREGAFKLADAVTEKWTEEQLDSYRIAHPLLGKLTARELLYFTIYHNGHHTSTIAELYI